MSVGAGANAASFNAVPPSLFWDAEHPTTQAHYVLAQYILFRLQAQ